MMWNTGFNSFRGCFGSGFFYNGWNMLIAAGLILLFVAAIYFLVRGRRNSISGNSALELLTTKYVKGEISEEEYLRRKNVLTGK